MAGRRVTYLIVLLLSFVFAIAYQQWLAWFLLAAVVSLPIFSLLISLPAMLSARLRAEVPDAISLGQDLDAHIRCKCFFPAPVWRYRLQVEQRPYPHRWRLRSFRQIPTDHCGTLRISVKKLKIFDYSGLFKKSVKLKERNFLVTIRPLPVALPEEPILDGCLFPAWKPKPGGGFAENHELRLYRPGDNLQQIHWKLSAKTGSLIVRQPMEPVRGRVLVRLDLKGTPQELDQKLGQLLWLGQRILEKDIHFQIQCLTGDGTEYLEVNSDASLIAGIDILLTRPLATTGTLADQSELAVWQYFIGGEGNA